MGPIDASSRKLSALEALELRHLPQEGLQFNEPLPIEWLRTGLGETMDTGEAIEILNPGSISLKVQPLGEVQDRPPVLLVGRLEAAVRTPCVRCLYNVDLDLSDNIEQTLFPKAVASKKASKDKKKGKGRPDKSDSRLEDWSGDDMPELTALDEAGYDGDILKIHEILEESLVLSMDLHPTCADEPLCDSRTRALLDGVNGPAEEAETGPDPRWAALQNLITPESNDS
jgi:uncharacterized metal-binding protein YceD (DUF177 family)